jgi:N-acetylmuramic acid 6-phosphate etherase
MSDRLDGLATEAARPGLDDLDRLPTAEIVRLLLGAEREAQQAIARAAPHIAQAAEAIAQRLETGGRLFYLGAGTPGRLAMLDAAELVPTFGVPPGMVIPLLAGGSAAMTRAMEGAEDDGDAAGRALAEHGLTARDAVVGITASGRTPYVLGGLRFGRLAGALTVAVVNNPASPAAALADIAIELLTGAEVIAGSTRLTAGTAQKIVLNTLSTSVMVRLGKTYGPWMVDVQATNEKLRRRAVRIVRDVTGAAESEAATALHAAGGRVKTAIVCLLGGIGVAEAERRLAQANGRVREALGRA